MFSRARTTGRALSKKIVGKISKSFPSYSATQDVALLPECAATCGSFGFLSLGSAIGTSACSQWGRARSISGMEMPELQRLTRDHGSVPKPSPLTSWTPWHVGGQPIPLSTTGLLRAKPLGNTNTAQHLEAALLADAILNTSDFAAFPSGVLLSFF